MRPKIGDLYHHQGGFMHIIIAQTRNDDVMSIDFNPFTLTPQIYVDKTLFSIDEFDWTLDARASK